MEDEIETLRRKIKELQQSLDKKRKERQKESQENYLMKAFDEQCKHNISIINEYNSRLNSNCTNLRNLKSVNINQIRKVMEDRLNKSFNLFKKNPTMGFQEMDFNNLQFDTEYLNNVPQFLDFICDIYKENLINLRHFSENVMTNQKAGKERVMEVEKLLELERRNHIYRFTETESLSKSAEEIRRTYEKQNESLSEMTRSMLGTKEYIASLTQDREEKKLIRQHMIQKQQDIHKLKEFRKAKYEKIQQLFSECDRIVRNYTKQKEYIKRFITEKIPPLAEPFASIMETLGNIMENECNLACKIPLDYLIHTECGEKRVLRKDLSIFVQDELGTALKELTKSLHFSEYKAIEYLLPHVMNMKKELTSLENEKANMTELITHMQAFEQQLGEDVVQQIIEDNTELEQTQKEHWLPLIERTRQECEEFKSEAENVHTLSEVWLNNPVVKEIDWKEIISMNSKK
ncbi:hypothetical protein C9374_000209 [Naegleria lovaniensis]|uniref:Uncharacterized protein n=1 Tax=Naegleria lovaniensis TaxID=51637 RepID=A0AA88GXD2_NAELO|nr:uncharacterized protein C9374_000209 [Naegleria lovaniensis]KAG2388770.1 hypothetical protein C9374_000209 [Naegleria lovaniensis]